MALKSEGNRANKRLARKLVWLFEMEQEIYWKPEKLDDKSPRKKRWKFCVRMKRRVWYCSLQMRKGRILFAHVAGVAAEY
jgi:hypothetical protein